MGNFYYTKLGKNQFKVRLTSTIVSYSWKPWNASNKNFDSAQSTIYASSSKAICPFNFSWSSGNYGFATENSFNENIASSSDSSVIVGSTSIVSSVQNGIRNVTFSIENTSEETINIKTLYCCATSVAVNGSYAYPSATWGYELSEALPIPASQTKTVTITLSVE